MSIIPVDKTNIMQAVTIHATAWKSSHRAFCTPDFIEEHTPERQLEYLQKKINGGTKVCMLADEEPVGIVSVTGSLIEDLYVLPDMQNRGYGTELLRFAISLCTAVPVLWILENNTGAERLYRRMGFRETGRRNRIANGLDEIEMHLTGTFLQVTG
ncbi:MAG: GNAT family N-acetyltransferase [Clostridia bacterium]|nr:GNAT family N-acetyltransferase [Clostridia bacterium]